VASLSRIALSNGAIFVKIPYFKVYSRKRALFHRALSIKEPHEIWLSSRALFAKEPSQKSPIELGSFRKRAL